MTKLQHAPGAPGKKPHWTTSRKDGIGAARGPLSHVWFAIACGIVGEIYYPRIDRAAVKDMGMIVTDGASFFSEEKSDTTSEVTWIEDGVPGFRVMNTCRRGYYAIEKVVVADPRRHVLLQRTRFTAMKGAAGDYHLYVLIAPHLGDRGSDNSARLGDFKGIPMLLAEGQGPALALACSQPWLGRSVGFTGVSDGWQDLHEHKRLAWNYDVAEHGNVAATGEIDISQSTEFVLALGFGRNASEAGHRARASLNEGFDCAVELYKSEWTQWQKTLCNQRSAARANSTTYRISTSMLAAHESKDFSGGIIASLSFPWGEIHGDPDKGGYHLVWPRDAYESASALLAAGAKDDVLRVLKFFATTQEADGHWPQNMWLDGRLFWKNIQLDEVAAPILLCDLARRNKKLVQDECSRFWPMVRQAASFIQEHGPSSPEDRWEEEAGLTSYTLATMIAALLIAADMADENRDSEFAATLRATADVWNGSIERWTYAEGTELARRIGVDGYYVRIAPPSRLNDHKSLADEKIKIVNVPGGSQEFPAAEIVSVDALALTRFGLRAADDPRMVNTVRVIDALLKVETPCGPCWHRYNHDGYGETADGSPFDGAGVGRAWPLFTGERAHYELAAGRIDEAHRLLEALEAMACDSGLISEQIWDADAIPERELFPGRPSGSARPLVWAHAEHLKLLRSLHDGAVFDTPPQPIARYLK